MTIKHFLKYTLAFLFIVSFINCKENTSTKTADKVVPTFKKEGVLNILKADSDSIVKTIGIEIADNEYETQTGLMYRTTLGTNEGMLFVFPKSEYRNFYMKNTKIPLDIVYIDENKTVVSFQKNAKPFDESSLPSNVPAKYVLEINAGFADKWQLSVGDRIAFQVSN